MVSFTYSPIFDKDPSKIKGATRELRTQLRNWMRVNYLLFFPELDVDKLTVAKALIVIAKFQENMKGIKKRSWPENWVPKWKNADGTVSGPAS